MPHSALLQALPDAAILTTPDGVVQGWNAAATHLFGWSAGEMLGRPLVERLPAGERARVDEERRRVGPGGGWVGPVRDFHKDGSPLWVEARVEPVRDESGAVTGVLEVARGFGPDRAARPHRYGEAILDSLSAQVAVLGPDGRIRHVNRAWSRFGVENTPGGRVPPSSSVGVDYVGLCRRCQGAEAAAAALAADGIEDVLDGRRSSFVLEYPCDSPTEARWFAMHVTPLVDEDGGVVVAHLDITARKKAEQAAASESQRAALALSAAHMGVWRLDLASGHIHWSAEVFAIVGVDDFDGTLASWQRLVHPDDLPEMVARFDETRERQTAFMGEFRIVRPTGEVVWLENVAQVERGPGGEVVAVVGTVQDVTARKRSAWALAAYNRTLEQIAAGAPLVPILEGVVRLVEEQLPGSLCTVLVAEPSTGRLRSGAGGSLPAAYNRAVDGVRIGPNAGSCGTAAYRKETVTVTDIATDPLWEDYREVAALHGLRSCVSVPILASGNVPGHPRGSVIGTFALYNRTVGGFDRLTYAILSGAERTVRSAVQPELGPEAPSEVDSARVIEAAHLARVAIERDQAGQAVRASEERFRSVFDSSPSAIYIKDVDGRHLFVNAAAANMFGVPQADWLGRTSRELLPESLADLLEQRDRAALAAPLPVEDRLTSTLPNGREATVLATHLLLRQANGAPYAICGLLRDITELVSAQREFERLWLQAPDPLCVAGFDGYLRQVNPAWSRLLGWTEEELLRTPYADFVHPDDRAGLAAVVRRLVSGELVRGFENRYRCRDGSYRWFSWNAIPVRESRVIYGITRDVTEEKRLSEQFRQSQKMEAVGQLASGVAHDFNNLLTVINGYTALLLDGYGLDEPQRDSLTQILEAGHRAGELTSQLLAFGRKARVEPKVLDINQVIGASARLLRRLIGETVRLETRLSNVPPVRIDPGQLDQVFLNLVVNARDAMPQGGRLTISTDLATLPEGLQSEGELAPGPYVHVRVTDTGIGMPREVQARIFEPFYTTKGPGKGTGLGLASVYGVVRQAGGVITVESEPGAGTTFSLWFPTVRAVPSPPPAPEPARTAVGTETVLLAEDESGVRNVASSILRAQGYRVLVAENGTQAARLAAEHTGTIDLLVTDVVMPDFGGRALVEVVRAVRPGVRVLYMSGYTDDAVLLGGAGSSPDAFLQKPFTPGSLARKVREVLDAAPYPS